MDIYSKKIERVHFFDLLYANDTNARHGYLLKFYATTKYVLLRFSINYVCVSTLQICIIYIIRTQPNQWMYPWPCLTFILVTLCGFFCCNFIYHALWIRWTEALYVQNVYCFTVVTKTHANHCPETKEWSSMNAGYGTILGNTALFKPVQSMWFEQGYFVLSF